MQIRRSTERSEDLRPCEVLELPHRTNLRGDITRTKTRTRRVLMTQELGNVLHQLLRVRRTMRPRRALPRPGALPVERQKLEVDRPDESSQRGAGATPWRSTNERVLQELVQRRILRRLLDRREGADEQCDPRFVTRIGTALSRHVLREQTAMMVVLAPRADRVEHEPSRRTRRHLRRAARLREDFRSAFRLLLGDPLDVCLHELGNLRSRGCKRALAFQHRRRKCIAKTLPVKALEKRSVRRLPIRPPGRDSLPHKNRLGGASERIHERPERLDQLVERSDRVDITTAHACSRRGRRVVPLDPFPNPHEYGQRLGAEEGNIDLELAAAHGCIGSLSALAVPRNFNATNYEARRRIKLAKVAGDELINLRVVRGMRRPRH